MNFIQFKKPLIHHEMVGFCPVEGNPATYDLKLMTSHMQNNTDSKKRVEHHAVVTASAFVIFVCLALLGINVWLALLNRNHEINHAATANFNLAASVAQQMDSMFSEVGNTLSGIAFEIEHDETGFHSLSHFHPLLVNRSTATSHIEDIAVYDAKGNWLLSSRTTVPTDEKSPVDDNLIHHRNKSGDETFISKPVFSQSSDAWVIPVSRRLNSKDGRFAGVILATISLDHVQHLIGIFNIGQQGSLALYSNEGWLQARRPFNAQDLGKNIAHSKNYKAFMQDSKGTLQTASPFDGTDRLVSYHHLNDYPFFIIVATSKIEILENWRSMTYFQTAWILAICSFTGLAGLYVVRTVRERMKVEVSLSLTRDELTDANSRLAELARYDGLTSLANRRYFDEMLERAFAQAARSGEPLALLMIDVDHFKPYNDLYGHPQGDHCLQEVARALQSSCRRPHDFIARYGGEEIVMILPDTPMEGAAVVAEAARLAVTNLQIPHSASPLKHISVSAGLAVHIPGMDSQTPRDLLQASDSALYKAKKRGRNNVFAHGTLNSTEIDASHS